jgi:hypothetical protein
VRATRKASRHGDVLPQAFRACRSFLQERAFSDSHGMVGIADVPILTLAHEPVLRDMAYCLFSDALLFGCVPWASDS